jgi:ribosomal protein L37AE/L43A
MTVLVDIDCPECGRTATVRKLALGRYRCGDCGTEFSQEDVLP